MAFYTFIKEFMILEGEMFKGGDLFRISAKVSVFDERGPFIAFLMPGDLITIVKYTDAFVR